MGLRKAINKVLWPLGYRIERVNVFEQLRRQLSQRHARPRFVQIGANDGIRFDDLYACVTAEHWSGIVVEPIPDIFEHLKFNYSFYPDIHPVNVALHPSAQFMPIYRIAPQHHGAVREDAYGMCSFNREHLMRENISAEWIVEERVPCTTLMQLVAEHKLLDAHYLQVDTEGFDAQVIKMIDFSVWKPELIKMEWKHLKADEQAEVVGLLEGHGYRLKHCNHDLAAYQPGV